MRQVVNCAGRVDVDRGARRAGFARRNRQASGCRDGERQRPCTYSIDMLRPSSMSPFCRWNRIVGGCVGQGDVKSGVRCKGRGQFIYKWRKVKGGELTDRDSSTSCVSVRGFLPSWRLERVECSNHTRDIRLHRWRVSQALGLVCRRRLRCAWSRIAVGVIR